MRIATRVFLTFLILIWIPSVAVSAVLKSDTTWSGDISVTEDILIPEGVMLTIAPGTTIKVTPSESSKMEPEYLSPLTEITVRGRLIVEGTKEAPVLFSLAKGNGKGSWAGIIIDGGRNLRSGDFNAEDVDARENWWEPGNPANSIFDGRIEQGIGKVSYEPYLNEPINPGMRGTK